MRRYFIAAMCAVNVVLSCRERVTEAPQTTTVKPAACHEIEVLEIPAKKLASIKPSVETNGSEQTITCKAQPGNDKVAFYMEFDRYVNGKKEGTFKYQYNQNSETSEGSLKAACDNEYGLYKVVEYDGHNIVRRETTPINDTVFILVRKVWCYGYHGYNDYYAAFEESSNLINENYEGNCSVPKILDPKFPPGYLATEVVFSKSQPSGYINIRCDGTLPPGYGQHELFMKIEHYLNGRLNHTEEKSIEPGIFTFYMCTISNTNHDGYGYYYPHTGIAELYTFACAAPKLK